MGEVYKAQDTRLHRTVAIKVLPHERFANPERKRRFLQEARAASALNHPNIVTLHDIANDSGVDFLVMEYVPGQPLNKLIAAKGLPLTEAIGYTLQIASALAAAHVAGIVHRDPVELKHAFPVFLIFQTQPALQVHPTLRDPTALGFIDYLKRRLRTTNAPRGSRVR